jgi:catechol 2,3-dioxygenase-like lactoylglutathione lyase family enzyme
MTDWQLTIDCNDPSRLVHFWAQVLGYEIQPPPEGFSTWNEWYLSVGVPEDELDLTGDGSDRICDPAGRGPNIWFQPVPEKKALKNRIHLDVYVGGGRSVPIAERRQRVDARVVELLKAGASVDHVADHVNDGDHYAVVMRDPEGNEFCVA